MMKYQTVLVTASYFSLSAIAFDKIMTLSVSQV